MRISDWSSDVCSSDLSGQGKLRRLRHASRGSLIRGSEPCAAPACPCRKDHRKMPRMSSATTTPQERRITVTQGTTQVTTDPNVVLTTVLGSCVAACLFDGMAGVGGMNHFLLSEPREGDISFRSEEHTSELQSLMR